MLGDRKVRHEPRDQPEAQWLQFSVLAGICLLQVYVNLEGVLLHNHISFCWCILSILK